MRIRVGLFTDPNSINNKYRSDYYLSKKNRLFFYFESVNYPVLLVYLDRRDRFISIGFHVFIELWISLDDSHDDGHLVLHRELGGAVFFREHYPDLHLLHYHVGIYRVRLLKQASDVAFKVLGFRGLRIAVIDTHPSCWFYIELTYKPVIDLVHHGADLRVVAPVGSVHKIERPHFFFDDLYRRKGAQVGKIRENGNGDDDNKDNENDQCFFPNFSASCFAFVMAYRSVKLATKSMVLCSSIPNSLK